MASYNCGTWLTWRPVYDVRGGEGSDLLAHGFDKVLADLFAVLIAIVQRHKRVDALSFDVVIKSATRVKAMLGQVRAPA